jgi:eukaryotic-like serine/threonine-protein kinase
MAVRERPHPTIPDHEVLRKIGGGAYGEVWLARGVTGALRAVKVVWREDFEDERGFEREFEGILKFEPISRDHPGLVNILHVGRSTEPPVFYYYVMQLGDDVRTGREINPIEYEPRTLRADHARVPGEIWETDECIEVGLRLAEALGHLHEQGLAHRDVKPSNIIFVNGKAKLADIGLVAARGQRTFVGTEGFVPPEGPGSAQADVYSLGKVLYEIATGKDRMNFPDLPEEIPGGPNRKRWLELNRVICDVCEPRVSKRKISTAAGLAESLRRIQRGKRRHRSGLAVWMTTVALTGFACWAGWQVLRDSAWFAGLTGTNRPVVGDVGLLRVLSSPEGADVLDADGMLVGTTNTAPMTAHVNEEVVFTLRMNGYRAATVRGRVTASALKEPMVLFHEMEVFRPPVAGDSWEDHLGALYQPEDDDHVASGFVSWDHWERFLRSLKESGKTPVPAEKLKFSQDGDSDEIVVCKAPDADAFCDWFFNSGVKQGYLTDEYEVRPLRETTFENPGLSDAAKNKGLRPFRVSVRKIIHGSLEVVTRPPGAELYVNGQAVGLTDTPLKVSHLKPGKVNLLLLLVGYKPLAKTVTLQEGEALVENLELRKNQSMVPGRPWENGIKMGFVPVGPDLMVSKWETRVTDYALFLKESGQRGSGITPFPQEPDHPAVNVSRDDAEAFCTWLTERERKDERIAPSHVYRLPTDIEWSQMADLVEEPGISPNARDAMKQKVYPWGLAWSDGAKPGNFADRTLSGTPGVSNERTIPGYDDGFAFTAPVGGFPPNKLGLYDLSGNVQEWVSDDYSLAETSFALGVLRGGSWNTYQTESLYSGTRNASPPASRDSTHGFRVVLAKVPNREE